MTTKVLLLFSILLFIGCNDNQPTEPTKQWVTKEKVFFSSGVKNLVNIFMMDTDGSNIVQITHYSDGEYKGPRISQDGKELLYYRSDDDRFYLNGIFLKDLFGPDPASPLHFGHGCDFAPDNQSIIYADHIYGPNGGNDAIFRFNLNDSSITRITIEPTHNWGPDVSPNGSKILFSTWRSLNPSDTTIFSRWDIMMMNIDGSQQEYLLPPTNGQWSTDPSFSNDGSRVVFSTNGRVRVLDLTSKTVIDIVAMQNTINELSPCFSPDDKKIYLHAGGWSSSAIYVVDIDGKNLKKLTSDSKINRHPFVALVSVHE